jgi:hypothetical protein
MWHNLLHTNSIPWARYYIVNVSNRRKLHNPNYVRLIFFRCGWRKLDNEQFHCAIIFTKYRGDQVKGDVWVGHTQRMRTEKSIQKLSGNSWIEETTLGTWDRPNIITKINEVGCESVAWTHPARDRDQRWTSLNMKMKFRIPLTAENLLIAERPLTS